LLVTTAAILSLSPETVRTHMSWIGHTLNNVCWIPQVLTCELKHICSTMYLQLLLKLCVQTHEFGGILSQGTKANFVRSMFEIEYGQRGMETRMKWKTGILPSEKIR
jgi:hypothetical protein